MGLFEEPRLTGICECGGRVFEIIINNSRRAKPLILHKCSDCNKKYRTPPNREKVSEELAKIKKGVKKRVK